MAIEEGEEESDDEESGAEAVVEKKGEPVNKAANVGATDKGEEKVLGQTKPQEQEAADAMKAGDSVGD